jgi:hypothetical protein
VAVPLSEAESDDWETARTGQGRNLDIGFPVLRDDTRSKRIASDRYDIFRRQSLVDRNENIMIISAYCRGPRGRFEVGTTRRGSIMSDAVAIQKAAIGKPFDHTDRAIATAWGNAHRANGIKLLVATDHDAFPEVIEIAPSGTAEPRWCIWRDQAGRLIVDNWLTWERGRPFAFMADALRYVAAEMHRVSMPAG